MKTQLPSPKNEADQAKGFEKHAARRGAASRGSGGGAGGGTHAELVTRGSRQVRACGCARACSSCLAFQQQRLQLRLCRAHLTGHTHLPLPVVTRGQGVRRPCLVCCLADRVCNFIPISFPIHSLFDPARAPRPGRGHPKVCSSKIVTAYEAVPISIMRRGLKHFKSDRQQ